MHCAPAVCVPPCRSSNSASAAACAVHLMGASAARLPSGRYISKHIEPGAFLRDFYALSHQDLRPEDRLLVFPPLGTSRRVVAKLLTLTERAHGVLVATAGEVRGIPELRQGRGSGATWVEGDGTVRVAVGPWLAPGPHAAWWPLPDGGWEERTGADDGHGQEDELAAVVFAFPAFPRDGNSGGGATNSSGGNRTAGEEEHGPGGGRSS